jgi:hypothetical protein
MRMRWRVCHKLASKRHYGTLVCSCDAVVAIVDDDDDDVCISHVLFSVFFDRSRSFVRSSFFISSYAVQLMTPCKVLAATNGRENIVADDVAEINELFFDSKQSSKILTEQADKYLY